MIRFSRVHYSLATQADLDREFRYALNWITDDFRGLSSIDIIEPDERANEDGAHPTVTIYLPCIENANGETPSSTEVIYSVGEDQTLRRVYAEFSSSGELLANQNTRLLEGVTEFNVERAGASSTFNLTLTSTRTAGGHDYAKTLSTRVASRN
ncbi:hypothetical protein [Cerasicoccus maritimus]|uniref:hypothetical protein n=1 Tax=Cerasicoccus maritimus TaxID=490089 RepID=UPI002852D566|nr:hypothetical protein [Cerasicoccus maritimus]